METTTAIATKVLMAARFSTVCPVCQREIIKGEPMIFYVADGRAIHEDCDDPNAPRMSETEFKRMDTREKRGKQIAQTTRIRRRGEHFIVPSQSRGAATAYVVDLSNEDGPTCTCPDYEEHKRKCKHAHAVEFALILEATDGGMGDAPVLSITRVSRVTYKQNWRQYNSAQENEREEFAMLLRGLCEGIMQPRQGVGRPRHHLADVIFSLVWRTYSGKSLRRMMGELREFRDRGFIETAPHWNTLADYDAREDITPVLRALIDESALPLRAVEENFAADSTGFTTSRFARWFDEKWGKERSGREWVKLHVMVGTKTHVVTAVEVTRGVGDDTSDCSQFDALVKQTAAAGYDMHTVCADKAYLSRDNLDTVVAAGGLPYVPFKSNSSGGSGSALWNRMFHYYQFRRDDFMQHYHRRSNVETAFSMIKGKFGDAIRARDPRAQENEVLTKVLAHNLCCLISSMHELAIKPEFWPVRGSE